MQNTKKDTTKNNYVTREEFDELKALIEKNVTCNNEVLNYVKQVHKSLYWAHVATVVRLLIIATPFVLAYLYFIPFVQERLDTIIELLNKLRF